MMSARGVLGAIFAVALGGYRWGSLSLEGVMKVFAAVQGGNVGSFASVLGDIVGVFVVRVMALLVLLVMPEMLEMLEMLVMLETGDAGDAEDAAGDAGDARLLGQKQRREPGEKNKNS